MLNINSLKHQLIKEIVKEDSLPQKRKDLTVCCLEETHFKLKVIEWRNIYYMNTNSDEAEAAVLISDTAFFRVMKVIGDKKKLYNDKNVNIKRMQ